MALETFGFISNLNPANPVGAVDPKSQGDDHLRGIKTTLQTTFPNASSAFYFPSTVAVSTNISVVATHNNSIFICDATAGPITITLLAAATAGNRFGFAIIKIDATANAVTVDPSGAETIDGIATAVVNGQYQTIALVCNGFQWFRTRGQTATALREGAVELATVVETLTGTDTVRAVTPDSLAGLWEKGTTITSAATITIPNTGGGYFHVAGTGVISNINFDPAKDGRMAWLYFDSAATLVHHSVTLVLPGGANIVTGIGDRALFVQDSNDNVICLTYMRANGQVLVVTGSSMPPATVGDVLTGTGTTQAVTPDALAALWEFNPTLITPAASMALGSGAFFQCTEVSATISSIQFSTPTAGRRALIRFGTAASTIVNSATLIIIGGVNITTRPGDIIEVFQYAPGTSMIISWLRAYAAAKYAFTRLIRFGGSTAYTVPSEVYGLNIRACSGGGGGGGCPLTSFGNAGGGGGGGGWVEIFRAVNPGDVLTITVGAGGAGGPATTGGSGGSTSIVGWFSITGALGGDPGLNLVNPTIVNGGQGFSVPSVSAETAAARGELGQPGISAGPNARKGGDGGGSMYGHGGHGALSNGITVAFNGSNGELYGAGGGGSVGSNGTASTGGNGSSGLVIIEEFKLQEIP